jgi:hypothetical protein
VARSHVDFEIVRPVKRKNEGMLDVGRVRPFPKSMRAGGPVEILLWQWDEVIQFEIVDDVPPPRNTHYLKGKKDGRGYAITCSGPVDRVKLNETPELPDNDYAFEPQHAYNVGNFERFPPFQLPPRFVNAWSSRRATDEDRFGGPLNRGFNVSCGVHVEYDNYPGGLTAMIDDLYRKDPQKYADLKAWADMRSPFISPEHAYLLQKRINNSWGAGGYAGYSPGLFGWDEEEMWRTAGIGSRVIKERPALVPKVLRELLKTDPELKSADSIARINYEYTKAWGDFVGFARQKLVDARSLRGTIAARSIRVA